MQSGMDPSTARLVLLIDGLQDLIKETRLADVGGRAVFDALAVLIGSYCADRHVVSVAVAGSCEDLDVELPSTVACSNTWSYYELKDPSERVMHAALLKRGYSSDEARDMIQLCGTRLRLLDSPLKQHAARVTTRDFLKSSFAAGEAKFAILFTGLSAFDRSRLVHVLDSAAMESGSNRDGSLAPRLTDLTPTLLKRVDLSSVLFVNLNHSLTFQSVLQQRVWASVRNKYAN